MEEQWLLLHSPSDVVRGALASSLFPPHATPAKTVVAGHDAISSVNCPSLRH